MGIVGCHQRQTELVGNVDGGFGAGFLDIHAVALDFDIEVVAKQLMEPFGQLGRFLSLAFQNESLNSAERQPLKQIRPSLYSVKSSLSMRGT